MQFYASMIHTFNPSQKDLFSETRSWDLQISSELKFPKA